MDFFKVFNFLFLPTTTSKYVHGLDSIYLTGNTVLKTVVKSFAFDFSSMRRG